MLLVYGSIRKHGLTDGSKWVKNEATKEGGLPTFSLVLKEVPEEVKNNAEGILQLYPAYSKEIRMSVEEAPVTDTGRGLISFGVKGGLTDFNWVDVYRLNTAKVDLKTFYKINEYQTVAHLLTSKGRDNVLMLIGDSPEAFPEGVQILETGAIDSFYPAVTISKIETENGFELTATANTSGDLYWETTGGTLSNTRTKSGYSTKIEGTDLTGVRVKVGFKYFSNAKEITL